MDPWISFFLFFFLRSRFENPIQNLSSWVASTGLLVMRATVERRVFSSVLEYIFGGMFMDSKSSNVRFIG